MKILIAEDEPVTREKLTEQLGSWGYDVVGASDGTAARGKFQPLQDGGHGPLSPRSLGLSNEWVTAAVVAAGKTQTRGCDCPSGAATGRRVRAETGGAGSDGQSEFRRVRDGRPNSSTLIA